MGEGGENDPAWLQMAFQLYEDWGISWNFWPWKKLDTHTSPCSASSPDGWDRVVAFASGSGPKPNREDARRTLWALLDGLPIERCTYREEVTSALLRRAPLRIAGVGFGFRGQGVSYRTSHGVALPGFRSDDQVTIRAVGGRDPDKLAFDYQEGRPHPVYETLAVVLAEGDWVSYEVELADPARIRLNVRAGSADGHEAPWLPPNVSVDGLPIEMAQGRDGNLTGVSRTTVGRGRHTLRLTSRADQTRVVWLDVLHA